MKRLRYAVEAGTLTMCGLALLMAPGCHDSSSDGDQPPAAPASAAPAASSAAAPAPDPVTANAPDPGGAGDEYDDTDPSAVTDFHPVLDSHGSWKDDPKFGTIWVPSAAAVGADFVPYRTGGHWTYGDDYTWVSDYDWGWAPFHYGRWAPLEVGGWGWIPGRVYSPAWVSWRTGAPGFGFVGWAPLAPTWGWRGGVVANFGFAVEPRFSYCGTGDLFNRGLSGRVLSGPRVGQAEAGTKPWSEGSSGRGGHTSGPPPGKIGVPPETVAHPPANDPGTTKAQGFSKPSTAVSQGGHPPAHTVSPSVNAKGEPAPHNGAPSVKPPEDLPANGGKPSGGGSNVHAPTVEPKGNPEPPHGSPATNPKGNSAPKKEH